MAHDDAMTRASLRGSGRLRRHAAPATELPTSRPPSSERAQVAHAHVLAHDAGVVTVISLLVLGCGSLVLLAADAAAAAAAAGCWCF